jgi:hypothetical protein
MSDEEPISPVLTVAWELTPKSLRRLLDLHDIECLDRRSKTELLVALGGAYGHVDDLLVDLSQEELERVTSAWGIEPNGTRLELMNFISGFFQDTPNEATKYETPHMEFPLYNSEPERHAPQEEPAFGRPIWWYFLVMPGKAFAWLQYMNPGRGNVLVSARHKNSVPMHVFFSIVIWIFVIWFGTVYVRKLLGWSS